MLPELQRDRDRAAALQNQMATLKQALARSRTEKVLAQERLDSYKYPVLTLPTEIVTEIFTHFLPAYPGFPPLTGHLSPTLLTQIWLQTRGGADCGPDIHHGNLVPQRIPDHWRVSVHQPIFGGIRMEQQYGVHRDSSRVRSGAPNT
ncbi:hypothetical protein C8R47DRAFT_1070526 [Mycena vitilis]|nr:hypothetical protein C8R47DRAFT_1070526 [Mycena vitilis]